jgi:hypothetical protein
LSPNFTNSLDGELWLPLTDAEMPDIQDAPENGGGDWFAAPNNANLVAKKGYYVIPTAQKWARFAGFYLEPRSNCGLLFWAHWDSAVGGSTRGDVDISGQFNLELIKTFDYTAIPKSALKRLYLPGEGPLDPENFEPPYKGNDLNKLFNDKGGASIVKAPDVDLGKGTAIISINNNDLNNGDWLLFFFYPIRNRCVTNGDTIAISAQVLETDKEGIFEAVINIKELEEKSANTASTYAFTYINEQKDVYGHSTFATALKLSGDSDDDSCFDFDFSGCNVGYTLIAFQSVLVLLFIRKKR